MLRASALSGPGMWQRVVWNTTTSNEPSSYGSARASPTSNVRLSKPVLSSPALATNVGEGSTPVTAAPGACSAIARETAPVPLPTSSSRAPSPGASSARYESRIAF